MPEKDENSQAIYFLDLIVENVRCFGKKQVLDLSDGNGKPALWTVILGDNGTGKTTLLKCLAAFMPESERSYYPKCTSLIKNSLINFKRYKNKDFNITTTFVLGSIDSKKFTDLGKVSLGNGGFFKLAERDLEFLKVRSIPDNIIDKLKTLKKQESKLEADFVKDLEDAIGKEASDRYKSLILEETRTPLVSGCYVFMTDSSNWIVYAYGASRRMGTSSLSETQNDPAASLFSEDVSLINAEEWLLQADFAVKSATEENKAYFQKRFDKTKKLLIELLPDVEDIQIRPITKEQPKPAIEVKTPYGWVGIKDLSLGYQTLMAWMVDLASRMFDRYPDSDNPLAEPAIVLVDEIDLHLHPKWQRTIMSHLSNIFKQTQFIVTAHSPLIVQSAQNANIVLLKREGDEVIIYNNKDQDVIKGWRMDQVVTSDLFDLPSARPAEYDAILREREKILSKSKLTAKDKKRLEEIGRKLDELPVAETKEDNEAMEIIRKAARILKDKVK